MSGTCMSKTGNDSAAVLILAVVPLVLQNINKPSCGENQVRRSSDDVVLLASLNTDLQAMVLIEKRVDCLLRVREESLPRVEES